MWPEGHPKLYTVYSIFWLPSGRAVSDDVHTGTSGASLYGHLRQRIGVQLSGEIATTNVPKLVEVHRFLHVDLRSSFGTPFQGDHRILTLPREGEGDRAESTYLALTPEVEHEMVD